MISSAKIEITLVDEIHRNEWLSNLVNGKIKNPKWNKRVWRVIHHLKRIPWIGKKIRGKLISRHVTKEF